MHTSRSFSRAGRGVARLAAVALVAVAFGSGASGDQAVVTPLAGPDTDFPAGDGGSPAEPAWGVASQWSALDWGPGPLAAVVSAAGYDTVVDGRTVKRVLVGTGANADVASADSIHNMSFSDDSGVSFLTTKRHYPVTALNMARLPDGSLIAIDFIPEWANTEHTSVHVRSWFSKNEGRTWSLTKGTFTPPAGKSFSTMDRGLRVHRRPIVMPDGTLTVPAYTSYKEDKVASSVILQSKDGGRTWTQRGQIPTTVGTNEVGWSRASDGRLVAVLRSWQTPPMLRVSFSSDDGVTWSESQPLLGPDGKQVEGIYPDLVLQPNGILLLATGRPDGRAYVSYDGTGRTWDDGKTVYVKYPSSTSNGRYDGTSGNNSMVNVGSSRTIFFGDKCHIWGCGAYNEQFGVFARYLSAVTSGVGRVDVATQLREGTASLFGDFAKPDDVFPEQRPKGAFDGSSAPTAAAVLHSSDKDSAPSMVLKLDRAYPVDRIGLMLGSGQQLDATVRLSADGERWSDPVVTADGRRDYAMQYTDVPAQEARYVKVTGAAGRDTPVTELEIHAAGVQTFENDPLFAVPRGFTGAKHAWTTDVAPVAGTTEMGGHGSSSALRLWDKWTDDNATATKLTAPTDHMRMSFDWGVSDFRGPFTFGVNGRSTDGATMPWRFRIANGASQTVQVFDGSSWTSLGTLEKNVALFDWAQIAVDATASEATVTVNGQRFTTAKRAADADALTGVTFSTGDPVAYGMAFFIDNLRM